MNDDDGAEAIPSEAPPDPAAFAFEALREEVALVRRAVAGLAAERASIEIPDYSETLGRIMRASAVTAANLKALAEMPALRMSSRDWGQEIAAAADNARRTDHQALERAQTLFERQSREMAASLESATTAERQHQWLLWTAVGAFTTGILLSAIVFSLV